MFSNNPMLLGMWGRSPKMQAYIQNNPDSIFARLWGSRSPTANNAMAGSNNAGGQSTTPSQPTQTVPNRPWGFSSQGSNNAGMYPIGQQAPYGGGDEFMSNIGPISFAAGGMLAPSGQPIRPGQPMPPGNEPILGADAPTPIAPQQIEQEAQRFVRAQPAAVQQIQSMIMQAMQSGELNPDELNMAVQLARAALANPASYPQIRQFAIQNGLGTEQEIPQELDRGLLLGLLIAGKALQAAGPSAGGASQGNAMMGQAPAVPEYKDGGLVTNYENGGMTKGDKPHIAKVHPYEYVATKEALLYHGKKTYDKLEEQAREPKDGSGS